MNDKQFPRGSEWRKWDLHVHSPASFHWNGEKFVGNPSDEVNKPLVDEMIKALNEAEPEVFALMDYWTFDGWFALQNRLKDEDSPDLLKKVFPGMELRLVSPTPFRLNAHVIFSDEVEDQVLHDFKSTLEIGVINRPLSDANLIKLARTIGDDKVKHVQADPALVKSDDAIALITGSKVAEITTESYKRAIEKVPDFMAVGMMPWDTHAGLAELKWKDHYTYFIALFRSSPIFESRDHDLRCAFTNEETDGNKAWLTSFQSALENIPRLVVAGSDAHRFRSSGSDDNKRGYGHYPSGKATWLKADPTFKGLLQAILEPAKRSFIGEKPPKIIELEQNKTFFIDSIRIEKISEPAVSSKWLDGCSIPLNPDLVAVIGSKGSGKSALADILALLGNTRQKAHFSFLRKDRFRGKAGEPAKHFRGHLKWVSGASQERTLDVDPPEESVEVVRYIPQGHFEDLCNEHVSGRSDAFEKELRSVVFSHLDDNTRLGALDFDQLLEAQEGAWRDKLLEYRKDLKKLNDEIALIEMQQQPTVLEKLRELLRLKVAQMEQHGLIEPKVMDKPSEELSEEQKAVAAELESVQTKLTENEVQSAGWVQEQATFVAKLRAINGLRERLRALERAQAQFLVESQDDLEALEIKSDEILSFSVNLEVLSTAESKILDLQRLSTEKIAAALEERKLIEVSRTTLNEKLNAEQVHYQREFLAHQTWLKQKKDLEGNPDTADSFIGIQTRIDQIAKLSDLKAVKETKRKEISRNIFRALDGQRLDREKLFRPVHELIQENRLIRDDYKLRFKSTLHSSVEILAGKLFSVVKQASGEFRGQDESFATVQNALDASDLSTEDGAIALIEVLLDKLRSSASQGGGKSSAGIVNILRKERSAAEVYDLLFGLEFMEPRYSLMFQDTGIEQLSPGQRGALLLIFYLLVDKGRMPIILDQPEENLDNETVVSLLVPVLSEAKKRRQVIMVTHNPNLAVVCDAEQVIHSAFDRKDGFSISYSGASIEHTEMNKHVVTVLEGTMPAFNNRRVKYH